MKAINHLLLLFLAFGVITFFSACNDDDNTPSYDIPTSYNFTNVSYNGQTQRIDMLSAIKTYMATSQQQGIALDANKLLAMYANDAANAGWLNTYDETKQLRSKTLTNVQDNFDALFVELATASQSANAGVDGISGVIQSTSNPDKSYLVGDDGLDHAQLIEKGLMGACLYYQATSVYMGSEKMEVDNETVEPGEGTQMEHHWDEGFGYFGVPTSFPADVDGLLFWGSYANKRDALLGCNQKIMNAFLKGRAAISAKDLTARDEAIADARTNWELIAVATALHYLNDGATNFEDMALRSHSLSEAIGFIYALQFNETKKITNAQVNELLTTLAGNANFDSMNLYNTSIAKITEVRNALAAYYNLENQKEEF